MDAQKSPVPLNGTTPSVTMTSLELVDYINSEREAAAKSAGAEFPSKGYAKLGHDDFLKKVPEVLGGGLGKFSDTYVHPQNRQYYPMYRFPKREACLMAMSYSYELQAKVFDRMTELEEQAKRPQTAPLPAPERARQELASWLGIAELLGVPRHYAQIEATKLTLTSTGVDISPMLKYSPAMDDIDEDDVMLEVTEIAKKFEGVSAQKVNKILAEAGLQEKTQDSASPWRALGEYKKYAALHAWKQGSKSGYNLKWNLSFVKPYIQQASATA